MQKECSKCLRELPLDKFYDRKDGKYGKHKTCKDCYVIYDRKKVTQNCENCGRRFKSNGVSVCADCGVSEIERVSGCYKCVFEPECENNIWIEDWDPNCFVTSKNHGLYVAEYARQEVAA